MDNFYTAVGSAGREVLIIRDNKVIGKGMSLFRRKSPKDSWVEAPVDCQWRVQEPGYEYRYFSEPLIKGQSIEVERIDS